jgi:hypothetical protein
MPEPSDAVNEMPNQPRDPRARPNPQSANHDPRLNQNHIAEQKLTTPCLKGDSNEEQITAKRPTEDKGGDFFRSVRPKNVRCLNPRKEDTQLPATILRDSNEAEQIKDLIQKISTWSSENPVESDWRLQCRTGKRPSDFRSVFEVLSELEKYRHLAPRRSDYYFFKFLEAIESPNQNRDRSDREQLAQSNPRLHQRNQDLMNLCNATEVIDGFAILAAGGPDPTNPKAPITVDGNTSEERRFVAHPPSVIWWNVDERGKQGGSGKEYG